MILLTQTEQVPQRIYGLRSESSTVFLLEDEPGYRLVHRRDDTYLLYLPWMYYCVVDEPFQDGPWRSGYLAGAFGSPRQRQSPKDPWYYIPLPTIEAHGEAGIQQAHVPHDASHAAMVNAALSLLFDARGCNGIDSHFQYALCEELLIQLCSDAVQKAEKGLAADWWLTYPALLSAWEKCSPEQVLALPWPELATNKHTLGRMTKNFGELVTCTSYNRRPLVNVSKQQYTKAARVATAV